MKFEPLSAARIALYLAIGLSTIAILALEWPRWLILVPAAFGAVALWFIEERIDARRKRAPLAPRTQPVKPAPPNPRYKLHIDDDGLQVLFDGAVHEQVRWADVIFVGIRIDDAFLPQPWWVIGGRSGGCLYPSDAQGWNEAMTAMKERLPGFGDEAFKAIVEAMGLMEGGRTVWQRAATSD